MERERRLSVTHKSISVVVGSLLESDRKTFFLKTRDLVESKFLMLLASYCYYISNGKDVSALLHRLAVKIPCLRGTLSVNDVISVQGAIERSLKDTKMV